MNTTLRSRHAFTAIELLMVVTIMVILTSMVSVGMVRSLRQAAVNEAASAIVEASLMARNMALREPASTEDLAYGVAVVDDPAQGQPFVAVIRGGPNDGKGSDAARIWRGDDGKARHQVMLRRSVLIRTSGADLRERSNGTVSWYFRPSSGVPVSLRGNGFTLAPIGVGTREITMNHVWGRDEAAYNGPVPVVAAGTRDEPGLTLRSPDGGARMAIYVFPSGVSIKQSF